MGSSGIPVERIFAYMNEFEYEGGSRMFFYAFIREMDTQNMIRIAEKSSGGKTKGVQKPVIPLGRGRKY